MSDSPAGQAAGAHDGINPSKVYWQYWTASTISACGSGVTVVAMPVIALTVLNASPFEVSLMTAASYAAWLLIGLPAGAVVQRFPLRATQVTMDALRALAIASVPIAYGLDVLTMTQLLVITLVVGLADVVFSVGNSTFQPRIVPKADLIRRNSITSGTQSVLQFGAPALAGLLLAVLGPIVSLLVDSASYAASSALLQRLPDPGRKARKASGGLGKDIREGVAFVWRHPVMRPCVVAAAIVNCGLGALIALLPLFVIRELGASPALVGPVLATDGVGSLIGAILVARFAVRFGTARTALIGMSIATVGALLFPISTGPAAIVVFCLGNLLCALGVVMYSVVTRTHRQTATPPDMLSRVQATVRFVSWGVVPVGAVAAGLLASRFAPTHALVFVTATTVIALVVAASSSVRMRRDLDDA